MKCPFCGSSNFELRKRYKQAGNVAGHVIGTTILSSLAIAMAPIGGPVLLSLTATLIGRQIGKGAGTLIDRELRVYKCKDCRCQWEPR